MPDYIHTHTNSIHGRCIDHFIDAKTSKGDCSPNELHRSAQSMLLLPEARYCRPIPNEFYRLACNQCNTPAMLDYVLR